MALGLTLLLSLDTQFSQSNADPRIGHIREAKHVIRYLKDTMELKIIYKVGDIDPIPYRSIEYVNINYGGDSEDRKSVMSHCFLSTELWSYGIAKKNKRS